MKELPYANTPDLELLVIQKYTLSMLSYVFIYFFSGSEVYLKQTFKIYCQTQKYI